MKSILIIVPYENIYPPMNGGMQRCFHILHQLSRHFRVTAIIHQEKDTFLQCIPDFPELSSARIYSTHFQRKKDLLHLLPPKWEKAIRSRWYQRKWNKPADGSLLKYYPILSRLLSKQKYDGIILESMATLNAVDIIRRYDQQVKIIYNAHNVDSSLAKAAMNRQEITEKRWKEYVKTESSFFKRLDVVLTCSMDDRNILDRMNQGKLLLEVVPNGVHLPGKLPDDGALECPPEYILFCGSLWSIPNAEGLLWFSEKVWPHILIEFPELKLLVVGSGQLPAEYSGVTALPSVKFAGAVKEVAPFYHKAAIAVVPLLTGSGTRLKVLEAMGLGVPVVSTRIGAEGIEFTHDEDILIADEPADFARQVIALLKDRKRQDKIRDNARRLTEEKYDWKVIGNNMQQFLNKFLP